MPRKVSASPPAIRMHLKAFAVKHGKAHMELSREAFGILFFKLSDKVQDVISAIH